MSVTPLSIYCELGQTVATYYDTVVPGEDGQLVQAGDEVPASGDVSGKEDTKGENRYRVHGAASLKSRDARSVREVARLGQGHWVWDGGVGTVGSQAAGRDAGVEPSEVGGSVTASAMRPEQAGNLG